MNIKLASELTLQLMQQGVRDFIICAGARNAPLVKVLNASPELNTLHFFDERAAGFFALGRARAQQTPVAVVTTSGTAVAELLPAAIEAHYSGLPVIFVTADRPPNYRGTGAPQAIEQANIFSGYALFYDVSKRDAVSAVRLATAGPTHVNICFSEPLIDDEVVPVRMVKVAGTSASAKEGSDFADKFLGLASEKNMNWRSFFEKAKRPLIVVGGLSQSYRGAVLEWLLQAQQPMILEAHSGLRQNAELSHLKICSGDLLFQKMPIRQYFDSVLRIGSVPTLRVWRDLEDKYQDLSVLSVAELPFSGLARQENVETVSLRTFLSEMPKINLDPVADLRLSPLQSADRDLYSKVENLFQRYSRAETTQMRWLSQIIPEGSRVMLGNSLPIREWDLAATQEEKKFLVTANRGANGIDGLVATFLGEATEDCANWLILGDLSALYDLNALAFAGAAKTKKLRIVVVNNFGGQIFKNMFHDKNFINAHRIEFKKWAELFHWDYRLVHHGESLSLDDEPTVIELQPDATETEQFDTDIRGVIQR